MAANGCEFEQNSSQQTNVVDVAQSPAPKAVQGATDDENSINSVSPDVQPRLKKMLEWKAQRSISAGRNGKRSDEKLGFRQKIMESPSMRLYMGHYERKAQRTASEEKRLQQGSANSNGEPTPEATSQSNAYKSVLPIAGVQSDIINTQMQPASTTRSTSAPRSSRIPILKDRKSLTKQTQSRAQVSTPDVPATTPTTTANTGSSKSSGSPNTPQNLPRLFRRPSTAADENKAVNSNVVANTNTANKPIKHVAFSESLTAEPAVNLLDDSPLTQLLKVDDDDFEPQPQSATQETPREPSWQALNATTPAIPGWKLQMQPAGRQLRNLFDSPAPPANLSQSLLNETNSPSTRSQTPVDKVFTPVGKSPTASVVNITPFSSITCTPTTPASSVRSADMGATNSGIKSTRSVERKLNLSPHVVDSTRLPSTPMADNCADDELVYDYADSSDDEDMVVGDEPAAVVRSPVKKAASLDMKAPRKWHWWPVLLLITCLPFAIMAPSMYACMTNASDPTEPLVYGMVAALQRSSLLATDCAYTIAQQQKAKIMEFATMPQWFADSIMFGENTVMDSDIPEADEEVPPQPDQDNDSIIEEADTEQSEIKVEEQAEEPEVIQIADAFILDRARDFIARAEQLQAELQKAANSNVMHDIIDEQPVVVTHDKEDMITFTTEDVNPNITEEQQQQPLENNDMYSNPPADDDTASKHQYNAQQRPQFGDRVDILLWTLGIMAVTGSLAAWRSTMRPVKRGKVRHQPSSDDIIDTTAGVTDTFVTPFKSSPLHTKTTTTPATPIMMASPQFGSYTQEIPSMMGTTTPTTQTRSVRRSRRLSSKTPM